jgi:hypothetical protein
MVHTLEHPHQVVFLVVLSMEAAPQVQEVLLELHRLVAQLVALLQTLLVVLWSQLLAM